MGKALSIAPRGTSSLASRVSAEALDELSLISTTWLSDRLEFADAKSSGELTAILELAERITAPLPPSIANREADFRRHLTTPSTEREAVRIVTTAVAALASGNEDGDFAFEAYMAAVMGAGYSVADLELAKRWLHTPPGHGDRPNFPLFRFRPSPGEWVELCNTARSHNRRALRMLDERKALEPEARSLLARRPELEAAEAERSAKAKERRAEFARELEETDKTCAADERTRQHAELAARRRRQDVLEALVAALPERVASGELTQWRAEALTKFLETGAADDWVIWQAVEGIEAFARRELDRKGLVEQLRRARGY